MPDDPLETPAMTDRDRRARSYGFDRRGPDEPAGTGLCDCEWSSEIHGDTCPEHGERGLPIPSDADEWAARLAAAEAERDEAMADLAKVRGWMLATHEAVHDKATYHASSVNDCLANRDFIGAAMHEAKADALAEIGEQVSRIIQGL